MRDFARLNVYVADGNVLQTEQQQQQHCVRYHNNRFVAVETCENCVTTVAEARKHDDHDAVATTTNSLPRKRQQCYNEDATKITDTSVPSTLP